MGSDKNGSQLCNQAMQITHKPKPLLVTSDTHKRFRDYCKNEGMKSQHLADRIIREWLEKQKETK